MNCKHDMCIVHFFESGLMEHYSRSNEIFAVYLGFFLLSLSLYLCTIRRIYCFTYCSLNALHWTYNCNDRCADSNWPIWVTTAQQIHSIVLYIPQNKSFHLQFWTTASNLCLSFNRIILLPSLSVYRTGGFHLIVITTMKTTKITIAHVQCICSLCNIHCAFVHTKCIENAFVVIQLHVSVNRQRTHTHVQQKCKKHVKESRE